MCPKALVNDGLRLPVHRIVAECGVPAPCRFNGDWRWSRDGKRVASVLFAVTLHSAQSGTLELTYSVNGEPMAYAVALESSPCGFGGVRWFARCPHTGRRASKLYLPAGGRRFLARAAYRLAYATQNAAGPIDRAIQQRNRILFGKLKGDMPGYVPKPKWMRWATFERWHARLDDLEERIDTAMNARFGPFGFP